MSQVVTELVIDASGSDRGEARYQAAMERIAAAEQRRIDRQARIDAAMERGAAVVTQTTAAIDRQARAWEGVVGKIDPVARATLTAEREMARAVQATTTAVENGLTTQIEAERVLASLRQQQIVRIDEVREAQQRLNQTSRGSSNFQAANIAAQIQDVVVQGSMPGVPWYTVGLQQGTQMAGALAGVTTLKGAVAALGGAFGALLNPVSIAAIAITGLAAAGVQWFTHLSGDVKSAKEALKEHVAIIKEIKDAYGDAAKGLEDYASKSQAVLASKSRQNVELLTAKLREETHDMFDKFGAYVAPGAQFTDFSGNLVDYMVDQKFAPFEDAIMKLRQQMKDGKPDFDAFYQSINREVSLHPELRKAADDLIVGTENAYNFAAALKSGRDAAALATDQVTALVNASFGLLKTSGDSSLQFALDSKVEAQKSAELHKLDLAAIVAKSPAQEAEIARKRMAIQLDGEAITESLKRQKIEEAGALAYAQAAQGLADADRNRLRAANDNIAASQLELSLVGKSIGETERLQFVRQQLAQAEAEAAQNGVSVSAAYREEIERLGAAYGDLKQKIAEAKLLSDLQFERSQFGRSEIEQSVATQLRAVYGDDTNSAQAQFLAGQIRINETFKIGRDYTRGFASDMFSYLQQSASGWKSWGDVAKSALDAATQAAGNLINKLADKALSGVADALWSFGYSAFSGGAGWNIPSTYQPNGFYPAFPSANGNAFAKAPGLNAYANTIVNRPTLFPFANGIGLMGETGEPGEAIMPLGRNSRGQLGVQVANQNQSNDNGGGYRALRIELYNQGGEKLAAKSASMTRQGNVDVARIVVGTVNTAIAEGKMDGAMAQAYGLKRRGR